MFGSALKKTGDFFKFAALKTYSGAKHVVVRSPDFALWTLKGAGKLSTTTLLDVKYALAKKLGDKMGASTWKVFKDARTGYSTRERSGIDWSDHAKSMEGKNIVELHVPRALCADDNLNKLRKYLYHEKTADEKELEKINNSSDYSGDPMIQLHQKLKALNPDSGLELRTDRAGNTLIVLKVPLCNSKDEFKERVRMCLNSIYAGNERSVREATERLWREAGMDKKLEKERINSPIGRGIPFVDVGEELPLQADDTQLTHDAVDPEHHCDGECDHTHEHDHTHAHQHEHHHGHEQNDDLHSQVHHAEDSESIASFDSHGGHEMNSPEHDFSEEIADEDFIEDHRHDLRSGSNASTTSSSNTEVQQSSTSVNSLSLREISRFEVDEMNSAVSELLHCVKYKEIGQNELRIDAVLARLEGFKALMPGILVGDGITSTDLEPYKDLGQKVADLQKDLLNKRDEIIHSGNDQDERLIAIDQTLKALCAFKDAVADINGISSGIGLVMHPIELLRMNGKRFNHLLDNSLSLREDLSLIQEKIDVVRSAASFGVLSNSELSVDGYSLEGLSSALRDVQGKLVSASNNREMSSASDPGLLARVTQGMLQEGVLLQTQRALNINQEIISSRRSADIKEISKRVAKMVQNVSVIKDGDLKVETSRSASRSPTTAYRVNPLDTSFAPRGSVLGVAGSLMGGTGSRCGRSAAATTFGNAVSGLSMSRATVVDESQRPNSSKALSMNPPLAPKGPNVKAAQSK